MAASKFTADSNDAKKAIDVCFGYVTAMEILRSADASKLMPARGNRCRIPDEPPRNRGVLDAISQVEAICPSLKIGRPVHVLAKDPALCRSSNKCVPHSCQAALAYGSLQRLGRSILVSSPPFAFAQLATCEKSLVELLQLGFELCGTYQTMRTGVESAYQVPPLTTVRALCYFIERNPSVYGAKRTRRVLRYIVDGSASPRETKLALILGLPMMYGGYGLGMPCMNYKVENDVAARGISGRGYLLCDLCWPEAKLDVEYQSREMHEGEISRIRDSRRANALASMGWTTVGITNSEFESLRAMDAIAETIGMYLGKRRRVRVSNYYGRKLELRRQLGLPAGF